MSFRYQATDCVPQRRYIVQYRVSQVLDCRWVSRVEMSLSHPCQICATYRGAGVVGTSMPQHGDATILSAG